MSTSTPDKDPAPDWPMLPNETEIYILPDGQVIIADLPAELMGLADKLGRGGTFPRPDTLSKSVTDP